MTTLRAGPIDVRHLGFERFIGAYLIDTDEGLTLFDCGPTVSLDGLRAGLEEHGVTLDDVDHLLLSHIHLDHAGGAGVIVREHPRIRVHVSEIGAPHVIDPSRLEASARRLYGDTFDTLWGELVPVPEQNVDILGDRVLGLACLPTPGHAWHHVSYLDAEGTLYSGDAAGVRLSPSRFVLPPSRRPRSTWRRGRGRFRRRRRWHLHGSRSFTSGSSTTSRRTSGVCGKRSTAGRDGSGTGWTSRRSPPPCTRMWRPPIPTTPTTISPWFRPGTPIGASSGTGGSAARPPRVRDALAPLAHRDFRLLFLGRAVSFAGSAMAPVALAFAVLSLDGSATDLGLVLMLAILPQLLFLLVGGVAADRLPRQRVMVVSNVLSGLAQGTAAILLLTGNAEIWHLAVVAVVRAVASSFFFPAQQGIVPQTVPRPHLQQANALLRLTTNATTIGGAALGGLIVAAAGPGWAIAVDATTYLAAAAILVPMRVPAPVRASGSTFLTELRSGWTEFSSRTWIWIVVLGFAFSNGAAAAATQVLGPIVADEALGGASIWGLALAAQGAGLVVGGLIALRVRPSYPLRAGVAVMVLLVPPLVLLAVEASWPALALSMLGSGIAIELFSVFWDTNLQGHVPNDVLSRVYAWDALGSLVLMPVAFAVVGPVSVALGTTATLWLCAGIVGVAIGAQLLSASVRQLPRPDLD